MDLRITRKDVGVATDYSWLASRHGVDNARSITLDGSAFKDKVVPSGTPVEKSGDKYVPYSTGKLAGFVVNPVKVTDGDAAAALLWHGAVFVDKVPVEGFTAPTEAGQFTWI